MKHSVEKSTVTIGELVVREACRILNRHFPKIEWLELLRPVQNRLTSGRASDIRRFSRREALPSRAWQEALFPAQVFSPSEDGQPLPGDVRDRLHGIVGPEADAVRVHENDESNAIALEHHADAVTIGRDVFFRRGRYLPRELPGFSLLTHEATHVVEAMRPGAAWRRATSAAVEEEEQMALTRERRVLHGIRERISPQTSPRRDRSATAPAPSLVSEQSPVSRPMKADIDRPLLEPGGTDSSSSMNMDSMKRALFRDLMSQIKVEFERGA